MIVLDTNVVSELRRPAPSPAVEAWMSAQPTSGLFVSAITEAELRYGLALLPGSRRRGSGTELGVAFVADCWVTLSTREIGRGDQWPWQSGQPVAKRCGQMARSNGSKSRPLNEIYLRTSRAASARGWRNRRIFSTSCRRI